MKLSHYCFDYDYDTYRACHHGSSCCDNDYCRCGVIQDARITEVPSEYLVEELKKSINKKRKWTDFENYCLGRLFISHGLYKPDSYELRVCGGYYGQEIDGIDCSFWDSFEKDVQEMLLLDDNEKIRYVLKKEYGYLLGGLDEATFEIQLVKYADILPPDDYRRLEGESIDFNSPIGIFKPIGEKYRIIDGHHRWKKSESLFEVFIIVANGLN